VDRTEELPVTGCVLGLDVGLGSFYTDSNGKKVENPRHLRRAEKRLKRAQRRVSSKNKGSANRRKAIGKLARQHLKVSRQRKDFAIKQARCVVRSNDLVALEDLKVRNMVRNHHLAKSIHDAGWSLFRRWLEYFGKVYGRAVIAVPPRYTSRNCSACGAVVEKSLSTRTHLCGCGCVLDRDHNAAVNILSIALRSTQGHWGTRTPGESTASIAKEQSDATSRLVEPGIPRL
jgi:putative transposase